MTPAHEMDISWSVLRRITKDWQGDRAELAEVVPLIGGCVNTTLAITTKDGKKAVLKICAHRVNRAFAHEAFQLERLRTLGLPVPNVYLWKVGSLDDPYSYLLMEHMDGISLSSARSACTPEEYEDLQSHFADLVLAIHDQTSDTYGRLRSDAPQLENWLGFFRELYDGMVQAVSKSDVVPARSRKHLKKIHDKLDRVLVNMDRPRLVHGDLWGTNVLAKRNGDGKWHITAILDPNCKYAHAEIELAYLELFRTATAAFFKAYQRKHRLPPEYHRVRKPLYQMYSLVNHVHLFGREYVKPLTEAVDRVSALV